MANDVAAQSSGPFEGPEKLLEIWFAPSPAEVPDAHTAKERSGLLAIDRKIWEDMLDIVKCKVLNVIYGEEMDAYLLSESSFFVSPHRLILKTCGTTLNLLGLPRILSIARTHAKMPKVYRCFYSRKSFMFPERQLVPHREWTMEVEFLDRIFDNGSAYTIGKVNGDHWLLYITTPGEPGSSSGTEPGTPMISTISLPIDRLNFNIDMDDYVQPAVQDFTIEILMTHLSARARAAFYTPVLDEGPDAKVTASSHAQDLSAELGISDLFPRHLTQLDAYSFTPCGYSSNALLKWGGSDSGTEVGEGYYTIHVTPEEGWSYASFECNVPLSLHRAPRETRDDKDAMPDLYTLIQRVVRIFEPGKLTLTMFISCADNEMEDEDQETAVDIAQKMFKTALTRPTGASHSYCKKLNGRIQEVYKRTDKINYEFGGYDLAFATFELKE